MSKLLHVFTSLIV